LAFDNFNLDQDRNLKIVKIVEEEFQFFRPFNYLCKFSIRFDVTLSLF